MSQAGGFTFGSGSGYLSKITGNTGGPVNHIGNNINVVGDGTTITISGDPSTHTLTASVIPNAYIQTLTADLGGIAMPTVGNINILGGTNVTTTRVGSTITISASSSTPNYVNVNVTPYVVLLADNFISVDTSLIAITIKLPDSPVLRRTFTIKDRTGNASVRNISVTTVTGAVLIDGLAIQTLNTNFEAINVIWNGSSYEIF